MDIRIYYEHTEGGVNRVNNIDITEVGHQALTETGSAALVSLIRRIAELEPARVAVNPAVVTEVETLLDGIQDGMKPDPGEPDPVITQPSESYRCARMLCGHSAAAHGTLDSRGISLPSGTFLGACMICKDGVKCDYYVPPPAARKHVHPRPQLVAVEEKPEAQP